MYLIQRHIQGKSLPNGYSDDLIRTYNKLVQARGGSITHPSTPWQQAVFTVVVLRASSKLYGGPQAYSKKGTRMYKAFKNTFASAKMPARSLIGARSGRKCLTSWGKLGEILEAVPIGKSVILMATGPEGLCCDIEEWAKLAHKYNSITIYIAMWQMPEWIRGRLGLISPQDPLVGGWTHPHIRSPRFCWSIISLDQLLLVWRTGTTDEHYQYLLARMEACQKNRVLNGTTYGIDEILQNRLLNAC